MNLFDHDIEPSQQADARDHRRTREIGTALVLEFTVACMRRGAHVCLPCGDDTAYDLIVDASRLYRVQVKSAIQISRTGIWAFPGQRGRPTVTSKGKLGSALTPYLENELDILVTKAGSMWFFFDRPHALPKYVRVKPGVSSNHAQHRERWDLVGLTG